MLTRVLTKMLNKRWMNICFLIGFILAVGIASSIPVYTDGILQRLLIKDMEQYQTNTGKYPGTYLISKNMAEGSKQEALKYYEAMDKKVGEEYIKELQLPYLSKSCELTNDYLTINEPNGSKNKAKSIVIGSLNGIEEHIKIIQGVMPAAQKVGDTYEVMVSEQLLKQYDLFLNREYEIKSLLKEGQNAVRVKIAGVYVNKDNTDSYWINGKWDYEDSLLMSSSAFLKDYQKEEQGTITGVKWYYALDYHKISISKIEGLKSSINRQASQLKNDSNLQYQVPISDILNQYSEREKTLKLTLWLLLIPVLVMVIYYLFMVSQLAVEQERNEIAVLKSRGASRGQIVADYIVQGSILGFIALTAGPFVGLSFCRLLGASNGFLEFVNRGQLKLSLNINAYLFSIITVVIFLFALVIPAYFAADTTIVNHVQAKSRASGKSLWKRFYLDFVLSIISLYGLYSYRSRLNVIKLSGLNGKELPMDPLLFLVSALFILGISLLFIRIFPFVLKLVFKLGKNHWGPGAYTSLLNIIRSGSGNQFIMIFLMLTISIGVYSANTARTINTNAEEKVKYSIGADTTMQAKWQSDKVENTGPIYGGGKVQDAGPVTYQEPDFQAFSGLKGMESATKVFRKHNILLQTSSKTTDTNYLMGIVPEEFGKIAWFRNNLLPVHWYNYLNVMTRDPRAMLVSSDIKDKLNMKLGDTIYVKWGDNEYLEGIIYGFVDYWPTYNPYSTEGSGGAKTAESLIVANLGYIQAKTRLEPYEVWGLLKTDAATETLYQDIKDKKIELESISNAKQSIIAKKNDALLQGINGTLSMGFIITVIITIIGFLIYWILSIQGRILQFGIFRAMGLTLRELISMLAVEQAIVSGFSILSGIFIGGIASDIFTPLLQVVMSSSEQVPPFKVSAYGSDYIKLYVIILAMLIIGLAALGKTVARIKINQAVKLGED